MALGRGVTRRHEVYFLPAAVASSWQALQSRQDENLREWLTNWQDGRLPQILSQCATDGCPVLTSRRFGPADRQHAAALCTSSRFV
eukprot:CAMPEP_0181233430 /NCGR_PEP_ID=MMETSP1096-20121128/36331_1 /TAXON_ID=156174 ORGANISM="Chrysochromulina ericina, Strain CCMP281" /NCGR_SAMPLE_ID=MMETSP1096 /ASSEMBLY_ACC=CAM_ASM_000453 /LENGTH=85 /DNA_ID=CAMNT_0023327929 /DNA_START=1284 /DNA_END=1541 /DNA_ORIENTATION=-